MSLEERLKKVDLFLDSLRHHLMKDLPISYEMRRTVQPMRQLGKNVFELIPTGQMTIVIEVKGRPTGEGVVVTNSTFGFYDVEVPKEQLSVNPPEALLVNGLPYVLHLEEKAKDDRN